ncbi:MAG: hypothetical protein LKI21_07535 [Bifidobacterium crudilactis]|jgi:hypothetical protein|nr:hypothetical protein [Bifidobacterium crudilactis]
MILLKVRSWIHSKHFNKLENLQNLTYVKIGTRLFENGKDGVKLNIESESYSAASVSEPEKWACTIREEQPQHASDSGDLQLAPRTWTTEFGYVKPVGETKASFSIIVSYMDQPGFLGPVDDEPQPSVPRIVSWIIEDEHLSCTKSGFDLRQMNCTVGQRGNISAGAFWHLVWKSDRDFPIIYISWDTVSDGLSLDCESVGRVLFPNALVCIPESKQDDTMIQDLCPNPLMCCHRNSIRIYATRPRLELGNIAKEQYRHRFFSQTQMERIRANSSNANIDPVILILRHALSQDVHFYETDNFISVDSVANDKEQSQLRNRVADSRQRITEYRTRLNHLQDNIKKQNEEDSAFNGRQKQAKQISNDAEQVVMLEDRLKEVTEDRDEALELAASYEKEVQTTNQENQELQSELYKGNTIINSLRRSGQSNTEDKQVRDLLRTNLPQQLASDSVTKNSEIDSLIVNLFRNLYQDCVIVSDEALNSLRDCVTRPSIMWESMILICRSLYRAYAEESQGNLDETFKHQPDYIAGYQIALNEGKQTHADNELMALRKIMYNGKEYSIEPHLKRGNQEDSSSIRIYYAWEPSLSKIIIGHIGKHLDNATTRTTKR